MRRSGRLRPWPGVAFVEELALRQNIRCSVGVLVADHQPNRNQPATAKEAVRLGVEDDRVDLMVPQGKAGKVGFDPRPEPRQFDEAHRRVSALGLNRRFRQP